MAEKAEATVVFGVLNETSEHESRVALTPDIVTRLRKSGVTCLIESGAGVASHYVDEDYTKAGAQVVSADEVIARADALGFVFYAHSPRYISPEKAKAIVEELPLHVKKIGLFVESEYIP